MFQILLQLARFGKYGVNKAAMLQKPLPAAFMF